MEAIQHLIPLLITGSLALLVVAVGLDAHISDLTYLIRRPGLLARSLIAISVVVPVVAAVVIWFMPTNPVVKAAIIAMAVSPLPPLVPGKDLKVGCDKAYVYGLYVTVFTLAIIIVPVSLSILSAVLPGEAWAPPLAIARMVLTTVLIPLIVGMLIHRIAPGLAERAAPWVRKLGMLVLVLALIPILFKVWPAMGALIGDGTLLAMAVVSGSGLVAGHLLGGPSRDQRAALALAASTRHPGLAAMLIKLNTPDMQAGAAILLFVFVSILVAVPYSLWLKRSAKVAPA